MTEHDVYKPPFEQLSQSRLSQLEALCLAPTGPREEPLIITLDHSGIKHEAEGIGQQFSLSNTARRIARESTDPSSTSFELLSELYGCTEPKQLEYLLYADMHGWATMRQQARYYPHNTNDSAFGLDRNYLRDALLGETFKADDRSYIEYVVDMRGEQFESVSDRFTTGMKRELQLLGTALMLNPYREYGQLAGLRTELGLSDDEMRTVFTLAMSLQPDYATIRFFDIALSDEKLQKIILESDKPELQPLLDGDLVTEYSLEAYVKLIDKGSFEYGIQNWDRLVSYYGAEGMELILPLDVRAEIVTEHYMGRVGNDGWVVEPHYHSDILQVADVDTMAQLAYTKLEAAIAEPWAHFKKKWPSEFEYSFYANRIEKEYGVDLDLETLKLKDSHIKNRLDIVRSFALPDGEIDQKAKALTERASTYDAVLFSLIQAYCDTAAKTCFEYADPVYSKTMTWYEEDQPWVDKQIAEAEGHQASLDALAVMMKLRLQEIAQS